MTETLLDLLRPEFDAHTAIIVPEDNLKITYAELKRQVRDVAETLAALGITRGDRVGLALPNGLPVVVTFLAGVMISIAATFYPALLAARIRPAAGIRH